jgi:hypothetical protein
MIATSAIAGPGRVVESHQIHAADAIQIAAALVAADERPGGLELVTLDVRQAMAGSACPGARLTYPILWIDSSRALR